MSVGCASRGAVGLGGVGGVGEVGGVGGTGGGGAEGGGRGRVASVVCGLVWGIGLRRLGCGCGRRSVMGSCVIRETTQTGCPWSRPRVSLSIYLFIYHSYHLVEKITSAMVAPATPPHRARVPGPGFTPSQRLYPPSASASLLPRIPPR